jgi:peptidoglycan hydrolase CwlO-like protein|tara:strand:- start:1818 stop:1952 length:135 start_codon:yes stop_codon:yes gene_type:complete
MASKKKQGLQKNINIMDKNINSATTARKKATHENNVIEGNLKEY